MTSAAKPRRIGFLYPGPADSEYSAWQESFTAALAHFEWVAGANLSIEWRTASYDQGVYETLARELAAERCDLFVTAGTPLTRALSAVAPGLPIVTAVGEPVLSGFAHSDEVPGGAITGLSRGLGRKARRQFGLLKELVPEINRLVLLRSAQFGDLMELDQCVAAAALDFGMHVEIRTASRFAEFEPLFAQASGSREVGLVAYAHGAYQFPAAQLAAQALDYRVATLSDDRSFAEAGCLMSFSMVHSDMAGAFAATIDRVLRGESPGNIPFALPDRGELAIHLGTATRLGIVPTEGFLSGVDVLIPAETSACA